MKRRTGPAKRRHGSAKKRDGVELTPYEDEQVQQIAAWKSMPPNPFSEMFKTITLPGSRVVERLIPNGLVRAGIEKACDVSERTANQGDIKRRAGVDDIAELRDKPLEECDKLANVVSAKSQVFSIAEGAATGAGGPWTTAIDIPLLFLLAVRTIYKIGHCYGHKLDQTRDRQYALGVLLVATSHSLQTRRDRLDDLHEIEDWLLEEAQEDVLVEELASFLFQLGVFEEVPGVGAVSGALLNLAFIRKVDITARRVFQERWLRDHGKVGAIEPAETHERALATGWGGVLTRAVYKTSYYLGFGASLPFAFAASRFGPSDNALARGIRDGAVAASEGAGHLVNRVTGTNGSAAPALAPA
jgi:hypothetical protein